MFLRTWIHDGELATYLDMIWCYVVSPGSLLHPISRFVLCSTLLLLEYRERVQSMIISLPSAFSGLLLAALLDNVTGAVLDVKERIILDKSGGFSVGGRR